MSTIYDISVEENTYEVIDQSTEILIQAITTYYELTGVEEVGPPGQKGDQGEPGDLGIPDKNFVHEFTNQSSMIIEHGLDKYPSVYVQDSAGDEVIGDISHLDVNTTEVNFNNSFSGRIVFN